MGLVKAGGYRGFIANGPPTDTNGAFNEGDFVNDSSGITWICTSGGFPGTWNTSTGGLSNPVTIAEGGTGATTAAGALANLGATVAAQARPTVGPPIVLVSDVGADLAWDETTGTMYQAPSLLPALGTPWNGTAVPLALAPVPEIVQPGTWVYSWAAAAQPTLPCCTAGNTLVLIVSKSNGVASTLSGGPSGVAWFKAASSYDTTNSVGTEIWLGTGYASQATSVAPTLVQPSGNFNGLVILAEFTGLTSVDGSGYGSNAPITGNPSISGITTNYPNDIVIAVACNGSGNTLSVPTLPNNYPSSPSAWGWGVVTSPTNAESLGWTAQNGTDHTTICGLVIRGVIPTTPLLTGAVIAPSGINTAANGAAILTGLSFASAVGQQLPDTSRDYEVTAYVTTPGTSFTVSIGPTSAASALTYWSSITALAGVPYRFKVPAGWYYKATYTTAVFAAPTALSC